MTADLRTLTSMSPSEACKILADARLSELENIVLEGLAYRRPQPLIQECDRYVYYAQRLDGAIKIGASIDPAARLATLRAAGPIELLATEQGGMPVERQRHWQFRSHRLDGEWFVPAAPLVAHIRGLQP